MWPRPALLLRHPMRGRPWRKPKQHHPVHQAQRRPASIIDDYSSLPLSVPITRTDLTPLQTGWTTPPETRPALPFHVERSGTAHLPVYTEFKGARTKVVTQVRKISGDVQLLQQELSKVCDGSPVELRAGRLEVSGNYAMRLKLYLAGLGF